MAKKRAGHETNRLVLELLLAVLLASVYFFCVKEYAVGTYNNNTNAEVFAAASTSTFQMNMLLDVWKGRLFSLMLTGGLFDFLAHHGSAAFSEYTVAFGFFQAAWLFLLFALIILTLHHSLFINLGIFAGVMYNLLPASGLYFYSWDLPATVYFTLAVLLFQRGQLWTLAGLVCAGCFFKETVLICALLFLFASQWRWWRRLAVFAGTCAVYVLGKKLMTQELHITVAALSMNDSKNLSGLLHLRVLTENLATLVSLKGLYAIFANAGTMLAVLCFGWQRRFLPYMVVILAFLAGQLMYGAFMEFRIFMQILPLSLMILAERWFDRTRNKPATETRKKIKPAPAPVVWSERPTITRLKPAAIVMAVIPATLAIVQMLAIMHLEKSSWLTGNHTPTPEEIQSLDKLATWYGSGRNEADARMKQVVPKSHAFFLFYGARDWFDLKYSKTEAQLADASLINQDYGSAREHYQSAMDVFGDHFTNALAANNYAWLLATCPAPGIRDGNRAVSLALKASAASYHDAPEVVGTLAAAYAEAGQFSNAIINCERAIDLARKQGEIKIVEKDMQALKLYLANQPFRDGDVTGTNQPPR